MPRCFFISSLASALRTTAWLIAGFAVALAADNNAPQPPTPTNAQENPFQFKLPGLDATPKNEALDKELTDLLRKFEGDWSGKMTVRAMQGALLNTFEVQQQYWWDQAAKKLEGLAVFDDEGILRYAQSTNYVKDGIIYCEVKEGAETKVYQGKAQDGGIVWLPLDKARALDQQQHQKFVTNEEGTFLIEKGYERYHRGNIDTLLLIEGKLKRDDGEKKAEAPKPQG